MKLKTLLLITLILGTQSMIACGKKKSSGAAASTAVTDANVQTTIDECNKKTDWVERRDCINNGYRVAIDKCYTDNSSDTTKRNDCLNLVRRKYGLDGGAYSNYYNYGGLYDRTLDPFYMRQYDYQYYYGNNSFTYDPWAYYLETIQPYCSYGCYSDDDYYF